MCHGAVSKYSIASDFLFLRQNSFGSRAISVVTGEPVTSSQNLLTNALVNCAQPKAFAKQKKTFIFNMPTNFDQQSYWHGRFTTETSFEWLVTSSVFMSVLEPLLNELEPSSKILQVGFGTSDLQTHLRARGFTNILNVDFEPLAIEHGRRLEKKVFGDIRMRYEVADATQLSLVEEKFDLVIDKSTVDAVSCGGEEAVLRMVDGVWGCLAPGRGFWVSLSYSSSRFDDLVGRLPFDVEVAARIATAKQRRTDPDVYHWCYLLRPTERASLMSCS